ncbi:MAG: hypothetical protein H6617_04535 [Bdellovibrionaceae bacterium]|nr:hypothetical protein [Pseudobdellovibrionaceae bacterium]
MKKLVGITLGVCLSTFNPAKADTAFGGPGIPFGWQSAEKQGVGTAFQSPTDAVRSKVWFSLARGILTEVYYPRIDTPQVRDSQLLVSDGKSFLHQEQYDMESRVRRFDGAPAFEVIERDRAGRYEIQKTIWADPDSDTLLQQVRFIAHVEGLSLYYLHKPAAANSLFGDSAQSEPELLAGEENGVFSAWQVVRVSKGWKKKSVGYVGKSDGFTDLQSDFKMDYAFESAPQGNVALTGQIDIPSEVGSYDFSVSIHFAAEKEAALKKVERSPEASLQKYVASWRNYLGGLKLLTDSRSPRRRRRLEETSILVLKTSEDKTYPGAGVASLSHPWGETQTENEHVNPYGNSGYHVVWPRDLYHVGNAFLAVGDTPSALAILNRMRAVQYTDNDGYWQFGPRSRKKAGSFPQNFWVDGRTHWGGYQADQTAMPVLFAYRLWKQGLIELSQYWEMVSKAASFLAEMGPWTHQERWEENYGISPNSAGYVIASLVAGAEMAFSSGAAAEGERWLALADAWALKDGDNLDTWTFTNHGKIKGEKGNGKYYLRVDGAKTNNGGAVWDAIWNPNFDEKLVIANTPGDARFRWESEIVDGGFLDLVRLGVRAAKNYFIEESIPEMDATIRVETPSGPGFYRYSFDGYGDKGRGRLWPFLTGERMHYELQLQLEEGSFNGPELERWLNAYENFASAQHIFSEQVWDEGENSGRPTGSATPLCWTHAEYLQALRSLKDKKIFEEIPAVRARYAATGN